MATASLKTSDKKSPCGACGKLLGILKCKGCLATFCRNCFNNHRNELDQRLDNVIVELDTFQQTPAGTHADHRSFLMDEINIWEQESISKIQMTAQDAREQVEKWIESNTQDNKMCARVIAEQIREVQLDDAFDEKNLIRWQQQLNELKEISLKSYISIDKQQIQSHLISNMLVNERDTFDRICGNTHIQDDGQLACHNKALFGSPGEIRGKREYRIGIHRIRFRIEELDPYPWFFFGIISKCTPMQENSQNSATAYGWAGNNEVYVNGKCMKDLNEYNSNYAKADVIELILDCDHRLIRMINLRSTKSYEVTVDLTQCPFPWMLHLNLFHPQTRLRINA